jgi:Acetokinase family
MAAALDGLDVLALTGGAGENPAPIRHRAAAGLGFLGVQIGPGAGLANSDERARGRRGAADQIRAPRNRDPREARPVLSSNLPGLPDQRLMLAHEAKR